MLSNLFSWINNRKKIKPKVYSRAEHNVSRSNISPNALKVLNRLKRGGYSAYLVGGCIRDLILEGKPKDFDVVTDASPEQIKSLFNNCILIGRRFRLAHVRFGCEIIEVSTFRAASSSQHKLNTDGMIMHDNEYGAIDEDAFRRDFTINALYYDIRDFSIIDYVGGMKDLRKRQLRLIGNPKQRYIEDPVRILRAIRFAAKLDFNIHPNTAKPLSQVTDLLQKVSKARVFEEYIKLFLHGKALATFEALQKHNSLTILFAIDFNQISPCDLSFIHEALLDTDKRVNAARRVSPGFLIAAFLWPKYVLELQKNKNNKMKNYEAKIQAIETLLLEQQKLLAIPKRIQAMVADIWEMQDDFVRKRTPKRAQKLLEQQNFRASFDFLLLRSKIYPEQCLEYANWWQEFQVADADKQLEMTKVNKTRTSYRRYKPKKSTNDA